MYKKTLPRQQNLFTRLDSRRLAKLNKSQDKLFYKLITSNIDESLFSVLYNQSQGRPNSSVRALVASIIYINHKGWTHEDFFDSLDFNLLTRAAISNLDIKGKIFSPATFYNFENRLLKYWKDSGVNLLELIFDKLTSQQVNDLKIKLDIIRTDSFQAMSNIAYYSRTRLLVEAIRRVFRVLDKNDKVKFSKSFSSYLEKSSSRFVYDLDDLNILERLAVDYQKIFLTYYQKYKNIHIFTLFKRLYEEHFITIANSIKPREISQLSATSLLTTEDFKITLDKLSLDFQNNKDIKGAKESKELGTSSLQNLDDNEATFRTKRGVNYQGQVATISESCNPKNDVNLIIDVDVSPNNIDDSKIFSKRLFRMKNRYSDINEVHVDGAYPSNKNDEITSFLGISLIPTGVRGRKATIPIEINLTKVGDYKVKCPTQEVIATQGKKRFKALFNYDKCNDCPFNKICKLRNTKKGKVLYFSKKQAKANVRNRIINTIPKERRTLRANVEATVKSFRKNLNDKGKLKTRGKFKTLLYVFSMAISINLKRIIKYKFDGSASPKNQKLKEKIAILSDFHTIGTFFLLFIEIFEYKAIKKEILLDFL